MRAPISAGCALFLLLLAGCQGPDVGQSCTLREAEVQDNPVPADVLEAGNAACDSLICIKSPPQSSSSEVRTNPYCSKPCVSNDDCYQGDTGLVCRAVTVDPDFLATLPADVQEQYRELLNCPTGVDIKTCAQNSRYCAAPVQ
jgi:hypothetical protein